MDPQACWNEIKTFIKWYGPTVKILDQDEREEMATHLENLAAWVRKGGFLPKA